MNTVYLSIMEKSLKPPTVRLKWENCLTFGNLIKVHMESERLLFRGFLPNTVLLKLRFERNMMFFDKLRFCAILNTVLLD
jgi:hypothetical protein